MTLTARNIIKKSVSLSHTHMRVFTPYILALLIPVLIHITCIELFNQFLPRFTTLIFLLTSLIVGILQVWVTLALTKEVAERYAGSAPISWKSQLHKMVPLIIPAIIISLMTTFIVFFGTLFLIIPGILFSVWYLFGSIALVLEDKRNFAALRMSKSLVVGRWWQVFKAAVVPTLVLSLGTIALETIVTFVFNLFASEFIVELISSSITYLFVPLFIAIYTILYIELRRNPLPAVPTAPTPPPSF